MKTFEIDASYWERQFPPEVLKQLTESGKACTDADGLPFENMDPVPVIRLFMPDGRGSWLLACTYPNNPDIAFGLADLGYGPELGDVSISELKTIRGAMGLPIQWDRGFKSDKPVSQYMLMLDDETPIGRLLTREEFVKLDPGKVYDDLVRGGASGATGIIFQSDSGTVGIDSADGVDVDNDGQVFLA